MINGEQRVESLFEVDEPTQPFSRPEIDRLRQVAKAEAGARAETSQSCAASAMGSDAAELVPALTEQSPERPAGAFEVSLAAFDHIGYGGAPDGMIGSVDAPGIAGEIGGHARRAPTFSPPPPDSLHPDLHPDLDLEEASDDLAWLRRARRRKWATALGTVALLGLGLWVMITDGAREQPPAVAVEPTPSGLAQAPELGPDQAQAKPPPELKTPDAEAAKTEAPAAGRRTKAKPRSRRRGKAQEHLRAACLEHRRTAAEVERRGYWAQLDALAQREACWRNSNQALGLRLRALFELERYDECVKLGANNRSKEVAKWANNCQRAR